MENPIKKYKFLSVLFIIFFIIFLISALYSFRGVFSDGAGQYFVSLVNVIDKNDNPIEILLNRPFTHPRFFSFIVQRLIYILLYPLFTANLKLNFSLYTFSLLTTPIIILFLNFITAKRTKRYDIAVFAFAYFCLFNITYFSWITRESLIATTIQFIYLQYFLSRQEKYGKIDILIITLISLYLFESFENWAILGLMFLIFGIIFYYQKKKIHYIIMGILSLLICMHLLGQAFYSLAAVDVIKIYYKSSIPWVDYLYQLPNSTLKSPMWISFGAILIIAVYSFINKKPCKKDLKWILPVILLTFYILFNYTKFMPHPCRESNLFTYCLIVQPVIFLTIFIFDYLKKNFNEEFLNKLFVISCLAGILQFCWQIYSSYYSYKYISSYKTAMAESSKPFIILHYALDTPEFRYDSNIDHFIRSIILSDTKTMNNIVIPDYDYIYIDENRKYIEYREVYYNTEDNNFRFKGQRIPVKTKYWDLTPLAEEFKNLNLTEQIEGKSVVEILNKNNKILKIEQSSSI